MRNTKQELNINFQYQEYLKRAKIREDQMSDIQRIETKRAFYGAFGQCLMIVRDDISDDEDQAVVELQNMFEQVMDFWNREAAEIIGRIRIKGK